MMRWRAALVAVCVALSGAPGAMEVPEAPLFVAMTGADGLPSTYAMALAEDATGYVWIGTQDGLARYDGVQFRTFRHQVGDPDSLPTNSVQTLHIDADDRLWVGTEGGGLSMLDAERSRFRHFSPTTDPRFALSDVWAVTSDANGVLWLGGYAGGLHRFDTVNDTVEVIRADPGGGGLPSNHVLDLMLATDGKLYVATSAGLAILHEGRFLDVPPFVHESPGMVLSLMEHADGSIWVGTQAGLEKLEDGRFSPVFEDEANLAQVSSGVLDMMPDRNGGYWLGTRAGLRHLRNGKVHDSASYAALPGGELLLDMLEDHEGGLWFVLRNVGLRRLPPDWANFSLLRAGEADVGGLHSDHAPGVATDGSGGLWLMHRNTVLEHVSAQGAVTRYLDDPAIQGRMLSGASVLARADGRLWLGYARGLALFDPTSGDVRFWYPQSGEDAPPVGSVDLMRFDADGQLWISTYGGGLQCRDEDGRVLGTWRMGEDGGLPEGSIEAIDFGPDGEPWLAGDFGLLRYDVSTGSFSAPPGQEPGRLMGLAFTPQGEAWVARLGYIERYLWRDGALQRVARIGPELGMPAAEVGGLVVDQVGDLWITTIRGLWRYSRDTGVLAHFGVLDGLPTEEFVWTPPLISDNGIIVAPSIRGVVVFDPARISRTRTEPRLVLEEVSLLRPEGRAVLPGQGPLQLGWDDRELTVTARLLSFSDVPSNRYRFRLRGFDEQWVDVDARGQRIFPKLPPGRYLLEIVGGNGSDVWSAMPLRRQIHVRGPWWQSRWAWLGYALALLALLAAGSVAYRRRLTRIHALEMAQRQAEWAERASRAKSSFLATMGHEIRTPMTGVLGMAELLLKSPLDERQRAHVQAIQHSGDLMLRLVNDALDLARIEAGKLALADEVFDARALVAQVIQLSQPQAERKGLALTVDFAPDAPHWLCGDGQRVQQIVLNLVNNAVKFTAEGEVAVRVSTMEDGAGLRLAVRDTGPGLDAEQQARLYQRFEQGEGHLTARRHGGSGLGLAICQELAAAMDGKISVESQPGQGATFVFQAPLPHAEAPARTEPGAGSAKVVARDILLVEDDPVVAQVISDLLRGQGHHVIHAGHGLAALAELRGRRFSLVLMDLDLPGLNGFEIARLINNEPDPPPIVALTARADAEAEERARQAGMQGFMRKPVRGDDLAELVRRFAGS